MLDTQVAQMTVHNSSKEPGNLPPQGKKAHEQANVIQLRSGTTYQNTELPSNEELLPTNSDEVPCMHPKGLGNLELSDNEKEVGETETRDGNKSEKKKKDGTMLEAELITITLPFPHREQKSKLDKQFGRFMEVVKNLQVSVRFTELITQVPGFMKFMMEILTRKRSFDEVETVAFTQKCSAVLQTNSPPKFKDPWSFSIPCHIGHLVIIKALCDLGASVSVMPCSICKKLNMGQMTVTNMTLQIAGRSIKHPLAVLEDVPIRVGKFFIPVDFVVLDIA
ncbi:uncharacterized protein LOC141595559 [Silene latifolia]|uniref:uncharacterized protein LOC141595559 n=1 Tax=Silene latifolia TaxID=37657 RepID=UPI003D78AFC5